MTNNLINYRININFLQALYWAIFIFSTTIGYSQKVELDTLTDGFLFKDSEGPILKYQVQPKSKNGKFSRNNYLHPVYGWNGEIITEDFPEDHLHHRGIFWAWHQIYKDSVRLGDGWTLEGVRWNIENTEAKSVMDMLMIVNKVHWYSPKIVDTLDSQIPFIEEKNSIYVHPKSENYRLIQIRIALRALSPGIKIGGSEDEKGYGGFSARIKLPNNLSFRNKNGSVKPDNLPIEGYGWMDFTGNIENEKQPSGIAILCNSNNPYYPENWILRSEKSMQNAVYPYPGSRIIEVPQDKPIVLEYRLIIHDGSFSVKDLQILHSIYSATD
ncbi:DUF6807 family protein [Aegicerativicinus sediminis]|uniref:DUF6807 family protein n=1 Tax=Aegicerativicinus sediminis TaxID=2893202 RepID=UPI001E4709C0|nr:DUF6807 family protein [Aegicerativicinus sediminis]